MVDRICLPVDAIRGCKVFEHGNIGIGGKTRARKLVNCRESGQQRHIFQREHGV